MGFGRKLVAGLAVCAALVMALPAAAEPALWKVQGPHATVYLFGTVHVLRPAVRWRTPKIDAAFKSANVLYEEIKDGDDQATMQALVAKYGLDPTHPISTKLTEGGQAKLAATEASLGLTPAQIEPLRPWMAALMISVIPVIKAGYDPKSGVDNVLKADAAAQGKPLEAFETLGQQVGLFANLPQPLEVEFLLSTVDDAAKGATLLDQLVDAWAAGDTKKLEALLNGDLKDTYPELYRIVLKDRNQGFADRIETLLKGEGTIFVAVGAAHLVGPDSVQADLARHGIAAVRQ